MALVNAKTILVEEQKCWYSTHSREDKWDHTFSKGERNDVTGVRTRLLRCRSPAR